MYLFCKSIWDSTRAAPVWDKWSSTPGSGTNEQLLAAWLYPVIYSEDFRSKQLSLSPPLPLLWEINLMTGIGPSRTCVIQHILYDSTRCLKTPIVTQLAALPVSKLKTQTEEKLVSRKFVAGWSEGVVTIFQHRRQGSINGYYKYR